MEFFNLLLTLLILLGIVIIGGLILIAVVFIGSVISTIYKSTLVTEKKIDEKSKENKGV